MQFKKIENAPYSIIDIHISQQVDMRNLQKSNFHPQVLPQDWRPLQNCVFSFLHLSIWARLDFGD